MVKPETDSKNASVKDGKKPDKYRGIEPSKLEKIQQQAVTAKFPLIFKLALFFRKTTKKKMEKIQVITIGMAKIFTQKNSL